MCQKRSVWSLGWSSDLLAPLFLLTRLTKMMRKLDTGRPVDGCMHEWMDDSICLRTWVITGLEELNQTSPQRKVHRDEAFWDPWDQ